MRIRKQTSSGDYQFGHSLGDFWYNAVDGVGQAILTRLRLYTGEWYLDVDEGTPWGAIPLNDAVVARGQILANNTALTRDLALKQRVLQTEGVLSILEYSSSTDPNTRTFNVNMVVDTIYGGLAISGSGSPTTGFALGVSPLGGTTGLG